MKKWILLIALIFVSVPKVGATEQISDLLIIKNDTFYLKTFPLEKLKLKQSPFKYGDYDFPHTACWRGYIATWKIIDDKVFLLQVQKEDTSNEKLDIIKYFKQNNYTPKLIDGLILADWYSDTLIRNDLYSYYSNPKDYYLIENYNKKSSNKIQLIFEKGQLIDNRIKGIDSFKIGDTLTKDISYSQKKLLSLFEVKLETIIIEAIILENNGDMVRVNIIDYGTKNINAINYLKAVMQIFEGKEYWVNPRYWDKKE